MSNLILLIAMSDIMYYEYDRYRRKTNELP